MAEGNTKELIITRVFDAPRALVFKAWTDPKLLAQWWGPRGVTNPECEVDVHVGGSIRVVMLAGEELGSLAGQRWPMQGEFREIHEPEKIVFTNQAVDDEGNILIDGLTTVLLEEAGDGKTKLTLTNTAKGVAPQAPQLLEGMDQGWNQSIDKLTELLN
jgi:uncharacterized protein YndB with AHSA1/START domain